MSDVVHACAVDSLGLRADTRFHRFFPMSAEDFPTPSGRTDRYTIVETPRHDWGIRGVVGDELVLAYRVEQ
jgi:hypothetical protein